MRRLTSCILLISLAGLILSQLACQVARIGAEAAAPELTTTPFLRVMSFNVRYNTPSDSANAWPYRKDLAASMIRFHHADLAGLQEASKGHIDDLVERLPEYGWFGVGRDDGQEGGEFSAIFYRRDRVELLDGSTFWLSEEPDSAGSIGWDADYTRIVTWGRLRDRATGRIFFHFNTHFDHIGEQARLESARLLVTRVKQLAGTEPVIVTGDFNCREFSEPYQTLTDSTSTGSLRDARYLSIHGHHGPTGTWSGFEVAGTPGEKIDHIFVKNGVRVLQHGVLSDTFDGRFPSDHLPVLVEVIIE